MLAPCTNVNNLSCFDCVILEFVVCLSQQLLHKLVILVDFVSLSRNIYLLGGVNIAIFTMTALTIDSATKCVKLLILGEYKGVKSAAGYLFNSFVRESSSGLTFVLTRRTVVCECVLSHQCLARILPRHPRHPRLPPGRRSAAAGPCPPLHSRRRSSGSSRGRRGDVSTRRVTSS